MQTERSTPTGSRAQDTDTSTETSTNATPNGSNTPTGTVTVPGRDRSGTIIARPVWDQPTNTNRRVHRFHLGTADASAAPSTSASAANSRPDTETEDDGDVDMDTSRDDNAPSPSPARQRERDPRGALASRCGYRFRCCYPNRSWSRRHWYAVRSTHHHQGRWGSTWGGG